jgi:hypothetical protein
LRRNHSFVKDVKQGRRRKSVSDASVEGAHKEKNRLKKITHNQTNKPLLKLQKSLPLAVLCSCPPQSCPTQSWCETLGMNGMTASLPTFPWMELGKDIAKYVENF